MIGQTVSHYQIEEQLGQGGMGIVYRAVDMKLKRHVALKFLPPQLSSDEDAKARFIQEAQAASALDHPNICTIYEIGEADDGRLFIAMSYYQGKTLKYLLGEGAMPPKRAGSIAAQIAEGLHKAHSAGIVHRDIKPANIMVTHEGRVKILDFGVAKLGEGADLTKAGSTVGTTAYMSPEQARGDAVDARTDLWSLGVILYELLSGNRAFGGGYDQAVLYSVLNEDPPPLEDVPDELASIVMKMIEKDSAARYTTAAEVVAALDPFSSGVSHTVASTQTTLTTKKRSHLIWAIPSILILLAVTIWSLFGNTSDSLTPTDRSVQPDLIVVLPFSVQGGPDMEYLSESMVIVLSTMLDGTGSIKVVDHAAVIEHVQRQENFVIGPITGIDLARQFGASRFILGSIVRVGSENRINARLYGVEGTPESESNASYTGDDDFITAIDALAAGLLGGLITDPDQDLSLLAASTTSSFEALKYYLNAERLTRAAEFNAAFDEIEKTLALDSTFALAWYLKAEIQGWTNTRAVQATLHRAGQYVDQLSGRARRLLDAGLAFNDGRSKDAERMYRAILRDYPTDIEATGQLAEVLIHYHTRESSHRKALELLEKVTTYSPGSRQFAFHHSDLLAYTGLLDGDFHPLDSLAATYADMEIPARGDTLDWSLALDRMNSEVRSNMVLYARIRGTPEDSAASYNMIGNPVDAARLWAISLHDAAEATFSNTDPDLIFQPFNLVAPAQLAWLIPRSKGEIARSNKTLHAHYVESASVLAVNVLEGSVSAFNVSADSLLDLTKTLEAWDPNVSPLPDYEQHSQALKTYQLALLAFRSQNPDAFTRHVDAFQSAYSDTTLNPVVRSIATELRALRLWQDGDLTAAATTMEAALQDGIYFLDYGDDPFANRIEPSWFLAELLELTGDLEGAIDWFTANVSQGVYAVPGWERAAALHEQMGNSNEAIRYYGLIANQWKDADSILQPRVQVAKERLDALLDEMAREPR